MLALENLEHAAGAISRRVLLRAIGTTTKRYSYYRENGLSIDLADKWSERLGLHPAEVWPNWVEAVLDDAA
jgi:hypothetical protein